MAKINLRESVAEAPVKKGDRYRVIIARPGQGSSGFYSEELFRRDAQKLIPAGAQAFINHGERDPEKMVGVYPDGGYFDEAENAVVGDLQVFEHWKAWMAEVAPHVGVSLYALGNADEEGHVTEILEDPYNGADIVARAGLQGSKIDKLYESAVAAGSEKRTSTVEGENGNKKMEEKLDKAIELLTALVTDKAEKATAAAKVEADAEAAKIAAEQAVQAYSAAVEAVDAADLFESQRKSILAAAAKGEDVASLIESAKVVREEAVKAVTEQAAQSGADGVVLGESGKSFTVSGWGA